MVPFKSIVRGALTRFAPGVLTALGVAYFLSVVRHDSHVTLRMVSTFAALTICLTAGYLILLGTIRPILHETAHVRGRRSFIAGFTSLGALMLLGFLHGNPLRTPTLLALGIAAGAISTLATFYPRLRHRMYHLERTDNGELLAQVIELAERVPEHNTPQRMRT